MTVKEVKEGLEIEDEEKGSNWPQILAICIACLAPFTNGLLFAWSSPAIVQIIKDPEYDIDLEAASYFTVIPPVGVLLTALVFPKLTDLFGRKKMLLFIAVPHLLSWICIATARSAAVFYVARVFTGIGDACLFAVLPMYVGEIATPKIRGTWGNAMTFSIYVGQTAINVISMYLNIRQTAYFCMTVPLIFFILFAFMPESPYYLIMKNREEEAKQTLSRLRKKQNIEAEFESLKRDVKRQMSESGTWKDLFTIDSNRAALAAGVFLRASQQLGGIGCFAVYTQFIFEKAGGNFPADLSSIIYTLNITILNFVASLTLDKLGRKKSYTYSLLSCGLVLLGMSVFFYLDQFYNEIDLSNFGWVPITGMMLFCTFYSFGLGIVPTLMLGELFSASIKGKGLCFLNIVFAILVSTITKLFQFLESQVGLYCPFLFFSICCLVSTVLALYFVPETKGKTLEQIQQDLKKNKR